MSVYGNYHYHRSNYGGRTRSYSSLHLGLNLGGLFYPRHSYYSPIGCRTPIYNRGAVYGGRDYDERRFESG